MRLLTGQLCFCLVLQFVEHAALGAVKLAEVSAGSPDAHPFLDLPEGIEGDGSGSGLAVGGVEGVIGGVLMEGGTLLSTLGWTGGGDEIA